MELIFSAKITLLIWKTQTRDETEKNKIKWALFNQIIRITEWICERVIMEKDSFDLSFSPKQDLIQGQRRLRAVLRYSINGVCQIILLFSFQCNWTRLICCLSVSLQPKWTCWLMSADFSNLETDGVLVGNTLYRSTLRLSWWMRSPTTVCALQR